MTYAASVRLQTLLVNVIGREQRVRSHWQKQLWLAFDLLLV